MADQQTINLPQYLIKLCAIAQEAGRAIMEVYHSDFSVQTKDDNSPVTAADQLAEKIILTELAKLDPQTPVVAEESASAGNIPAIMDRFYLVDPLDGTREFLKRNGEFTVNIALIEGRKPVAGVVYAPALAEIFAAQGGAAYRGQLDITAALESAHLAHLVSNTAKPEKMIGIASRSHRDAETENYLRSHSITEVISAGSSLKFCAIAAGRAHVYPRFGRTMEWDTAAGHAVLVAAGGKVCTSDGKSLEYGKADQAFANPTFIASSF